MTFDKSYIGILYSTATGIVLRTINPDFDAHLDWLAKNTPAGTTLLCIPKADVGADDQHTPNLDALIPYAAKNYAVTLSYGKECAIVDASNKVVDVVLACPSLYQTKLDADAAKSLAVPNTVIQLPANIGDTYDPVNKKIIPATKTQALIT